MSRQVRALSIGIILCVAFGSNLAAQEVRVRVSPELTVPIADPDRVFGVGGGASLVFDVELLPFLAPYAGLDLRFVAPSAPGMRASLMLASAGTGLGIFAFPLPRLKVGASAGAGVYVGSWQSNAGTAMTGNILWRAAVQAGYRLRPSLNLSGGVSYTDYLADRDAASASLYRGLSFSLVADLGFGGRAVEGRAALQSVESVPVFPVLAPDHAARPFGSLTVRNAESAELRNVEVWFHVDGYTSGPAFCGRVPYLPRGAVATVPLLASFSDQVLTVAETVRVSAEVRIIYELLGEPRTAKADTAISILHRNALTWDDPRVLAAFVSPNDPAVLDMSKYIAGLVRSRTRTEIDSNLQYAIGIFEGLRLSGIAWGPDPQTPYAAMRSSASEIDYVQFPHQTIAYRGGDSDDLAVLFAAALESVGVPAALIPLEREVIAAFMLSRDERATRDMFLDHGDFIFIDGEAWVPVNVTRIRDGFLRAWREGASSVASASDYRDRFYRLSDAWLRYPPAGIPDVPAATRKPTEEQLMTAFDSVLSLVVAREVTPRADRLRASFGPQGGTARQRNLLGVLYARYGMYAEALPELKAAEALGFAGAPVNLGNLAFLVGDYAAAVQWYEKALADSALETAAIIGLARSYYELDRYDKADLYFGMAVEARPDLAERYGYLSAQLSGPAARASATADRGGDMLWDE